MIAVECRGRLGNQLFEFALGIAVSARLGTTFVMLDDGLRLLFELTPYSRTLRRAFRALHFRLGHRRDPYPIVRDYEFGSPGDRLAGVRDRVIYRGWFQSEAFFENARYCVLDAFTVRAKHERRFRKRYSRLLAAPYVCCHVRRGDYHGFRDSPVLPLEYYNNALGLLGAGDELPVVFVGDDFNGIRDDLLGIPGARIERNDAILDFPPLIHAAGVVTSNSTFSWWGAYLNRTQGATVITPRHWLGFKEGVEYPRDIIPARWLQIDVPCDRLEI